MAEASPGDAKATERLHEYWVHGEGAAKIGWGQGGDFDRCVLELGKYIKDPKGYCAKAHHEATGMWPAQHAAMEKKATGRSAVTTPAGDYDADGLDGSWDGDCSDLPDMTGLGVPHMEAAEKAMGAPPAAQPPSQRAAKLGSGARFKKLQGSLAAKGASDPGALAAWIGRKKYGKGKFMKLAAKARGGSSRTDPADSGRAESLAPFYRDFPLTDLSVRSGGRDGRIVSAYAAVFDTPTEIHDQDGDYHEVIDPSAFNRAISDARPAGGRKAWKVGVFYNHGRTLAGTPSDRHSMPIGVPIDIRADAVGVLTETQYHRSDFCEEIVEGLESGAIPGYSFSGMFRRSQPLIPRGGFRRDRAGSMQTVRRTESTLREYGPTPFPAYADAAIVGMRAETILAAMASDPELATRMIGMFRDGAPVDSPPQSGAPQDGDSPAEDSHQLVRSGRSVKEEMQARRSAFLQRYRR